jgi:predicted permease
VAEGEDPESARLAATKEFGNVLHATEAARRVWRGRLVELLVDLWQDVRFGVRMLAKNPGFSLVVIAVLTLGIAGNAAVFSLFKALALKPLPGVDDSASMAVVLSRTRSGRHLGLSVPDYRDIRDHDRAFVDLAASAMIFATVGQGAEAERIVAELVSGTYFGALRVGAQLGRTLQPSDDVAPGRHPVAVIGDGFWRRTFGGDPGIVGKTLYLNGQPLTVVGVAAPEFRGTVVSMVVDVFAPLMMQPQVWPPNRLDQRTATMLMTIGHLRPGVTVAQAAAATQVLGAQLDRDKPLANFSSRATVVPIWQSPYGAQTYWLPALVLIGAMGLLILLVVCANVANLVLVRGVGRRGEIAVRLALGASRGRILRLLFVENVVLAIPGALAGIALARVLLPLVASGAASAAPTRVYVDTAVDGYVLAFAFSLAVVCALVFGFVPALRTSRVELSSLASDLASRTTSRNRLRNTLVVAQVAVSLVLLVGAALVLRSYEAARGASGGFDAANVTAVAFDLQPRGYDGERSRVFLDRLLDGLGGEPSVESVSFAYSLPLSLVDGATRPITIEGYTPRADEDFSFMFNTVGPDYFRTLRIPLAAGRDFARTDDASAPAVVVINETLARRMWQTPEHAIGRRLRGTTGDWRTVVGVARDVKYARLTEPPRPYVYFPALQSEVTSLFIHARSPGDQTALLRRIRNHVHAVDPLVPVLSSRMLPETTRVALSVYELAAGLLSMFGLMTIVLASLGIYGLVAYSVRQSTQEIGIRLAVGASRGAVAWTFLKRGAGLAVAGTAIGLSIAAAAGGAMGTVLYGVSPRDAVAFGSGAAVVLAIALAASLVPAWRAARTDPLAALRHQ